MNALRQAPGQESAWMAEISVHRHSQPALRGQRSIVKVHGRVLAARNGAAWLIPLRSGADGGGGGGTVCLYESSGDAMRRG